MTRFRKLRSFALVLLFALASVPSALAADKYAIDADHSMVIFKVKHLGVGNNYGRFNDVSGEFTFDPGSPAKSAL